VSCIQEQELSWIFPTGKWLSDYCRVITKLTAYLGKDLEELFGKEEASAIRDLIHDVEEKMIKEVKARVGILKGKMATLTAEELEARREAKQPKFLHVVFTSGSATFARKCPTCDSLGSLHASPVGSIPPSLKGPELIVQKVFAPKKFNCDVCGLELTGLHELRVVELGDQITMDEEVDPVSYFSDRFDEAFEEHYEERVRSEMYEPDYGND
jgi:hypothetical protein